MIGLFRQMPTMAAVVSLGLIVFGTTQAPAGLLPNLRSVTQVDGNFKYNYDVDVGPKSQVNPGDFFTIYDFAGYIPSSTSGPAGWSFSYQLNGKDPPQTTPINNPEIGNLTWTYTGTNPIF